MPSPINRTKANARSEDTEGKRFRGFKWILRGDMSVKRQNKSAENTCGKLQVWQQRPTSNEGSEPKLDWSEGLKGNTGPVPVLMVMLREFRNMKNTASRMSAMAFEYRVR